VGVRLVECGSGGIRATELVQHREVVDDPRLPSGAHVESRLEQLARQGLALVAQHLSCGLRLRNRAGPVDDCQQRVGVLPGGVPLSWRCTASRSLLEPVTPSTAVALARHSSDSILQTKDRCRWTSRGRARPVIRVALGCAGSSWCMACRSSDHRGSCADRERPQRLARRGAGAHRQGRQTTRGRHGRLGWEHLEPWLQIRARFELPH
jgi:hypothetical protein